MNKLTQLLGAMLLSGAATVSVAATSVKATINGMVCAFCAQGIEKRLSALPATQAVFIDLKRRVVLVEAKPGQTLDGQTIKSEITDAGYDVTKLETLEQSVSEFKAGLEAVK